MKFGLDQKTIDKITREFESFTGIERVVLYGSRAKGDFKNGSDIDLTIYSSDFSISELTKLEARLDELMLPYKIDISLHHQISNPDLLDHIERVGVIFYVR